MSYEIRPLTEDFGVEVVGLDLNEPLDETTLRDLKRAWFENAVMVIRDQELPPDKQVAFSQCFGECHVHVMKQFQYPGHPEVLVLSNRKRADGTPAGFEDAGRYWHSDFSYDANPSLVTMLYAVEIPPKGGDTHFIDMFRAYETLPEATKKRIEGRYAYHSYTHNYATNTNNPANRPKLSEEAKQSLKDVVHPIVRRHEDTGRRSLFVSPGFSYKVKGMSDEEGETLLKELFQHVFKPEFRYIHRWQPHDFICWDNRGTIHCATPYDTSYTRHMHRTTLKGPRPVA